MITVVVLTISDKGSEGKREDVSGPLIADILKPIQAEVKHYEILPDEKELIRDRLIQYCGQVDLIFTTGGTGLSPRDVTPDATLEVIDKEIPGISEAMRSEGFKKTRKSILSRAVAGIKGGTLIINLPGSPKAVRESLEVILDAIPHAIEKIKGDTTECAIP
jgi:molybdopterin adenylyltransferase